MNFQTCTKVPVVGSAPTKSKTVTDRGGGGMSEKSKRYSTRHLPMTVIAFRPCRILPGAVRLPDTSDDTTRYTVSSF